MEKCARMSIFGIFFYIKNAQKRKNAKKIETHPPLLGPTKGFFSPPDSHFWVIGGGRMNMARPTCTPHGLECLPPLCLSICPPPQGQHSVKRSLVRTNCTVYCCTGSSAAVVGELGAAERRRSSPEETGRQGSRRGCQTTRRHSSQR